MATNSLQLKSKLIVYKHSYQWPALAGIILLAALLRFYKLGTWSFWGDEYITVRRASALFDLSYSRYSISLLATHASQNIWGITEWSARLAPAVIGVLSIPLLFILIRKMFDPFIALLASLFLAISPWHIYWSQNARFYTALLLFYWLALLLFYLGLEEDRPWYLLLALVTLVLALQERLIAAFFMPVALTYIFLLKLLPFQKPPGLHRRNLLLFFTPTLLGGLILAISLLPAQAPVQWSQIWTTGFSFRNNTPFWILAGVVFYAGIPLVCMSGLGAFFLLRVKKRSGLLLAIAAALPLIAVMFISLFQYTANRYVFISLTGLVILAAVAVMELIRQSPKESLLLAVGLLAILVSAPLADDMLYYRYQNGNRDNWRDAFAFIAGQKQPLDRVITTHPELANYYLHESTGSLLGMDMAAIESSPERTWFIIDLTAPNKAPNKTRWIQENAQLMATLDVTVSARVFPMRIYLFEPEPSTTPEVTTTQPVN